MIMKNGKQIGFIYKNGEKIDKIIRHGKVYFEQGFTRKKTSTTLPISFNGISKDLKDYKIYGNTYQNSTTGKNLRYIEDKTSADVSLTYDNKSGKISIRGTATKTTGIELSKGGGVNIPAGTYTLSVSEPLPILINSIVSLSNSTNVAFRMPAGNTSVTANVPSDGMLASLYFAVTNGTTYNFDFYLQLEEGSVATEFEPFTNGASPNPGYPQEIVSCGDLITNTSDINYGKYKIPVNVNNVITNIYLDEPLRKIGNYSDYIDFKNGKVIRNISEVILNGSESWSSYGANLYTLQTFFNNNHFIVGYGLSNLYRYNSIQSGIANGTVNGEFVLQKSNRNYNLFIKNTDIGSLENLKSDLSTKNMIINYPLETSTEESITLPNIPTIDGNNALNIETEITPSQVYIKYKSNN